MYQKSIERVTNTGLVSKLLRLPGADVSADIALDPFTGAMAGLATNCAHDLVMSQQGIT